MCLCSTLISVTSSLDSPSFSHAMTGAKPRQHLFSAQLFSQKENFFLILLWSEFTALVGSSKLTYYVISLLSYYGVPL